jgi:GNAT superfamily N-acetyltransferase
MAGMSISVDRSHAAGSSAGVQPEFRIVQAAYAQARAAGLEDLIQAEYVLRYGGPDETPMDAAEFSPPTGRFLIGYLDRAGEPRDAQGRPGMGGPEGAAVACGGWRTHAPGTAEIKRMFVAATARRRGLAARILAELERTAADAGFTTMLLETGDAQPEAIALYTRAGYTPIERFGYYRDSPRSVSLAKKLNPPP